MCPSLDAFHAQIRESYALCRPPLVAVLGTEPGELLNQEVKTNGLGKSWPAHRTALIAIVRNHVYRHQTSPQVITNLFREKQARDPA